MRTTNRICIICKGKFYARPVTIRTGGGKYCSENCKFKGLRKGKNYNCSVCGKEFYRNPSMSRSKHGKLFCSHSCAAKQNNTLKAGENHPNWLGGHGSYRIRAIRVYGLKCRNGDNCPLKNINNLPKFMFEVDHINGDKKDNKVLNLQILCVWCHRAKTVSTIMRSGAIGSHITL